MREFNHEVEAPQKAVLYCRVSGKKQTKDGSGLSSQEHRCRQYAEAKGYEVVRVFPDDKSGEGDFVKRPGMVDLLKFLDANPQESFAVIFDDLKRYSRDTEFHLKLRRLMLERGATRECLNFNFENSPEGKFNETITAAAGTYERESMGRQNWQKSIARIEQGYCVQAVPPVGYKYQKSPSGGKVLVRDEPAASAVQEALEGYATGRFASQVEVKRFLDAHPHFPKKKRSGTLTQHTVVKMMRRHLYAGLIDGRAWGVSIRDGRHEGLISVQTFERIQDKLDGRVYALPQKNIHEDFPLRGAVCCSECGTPLTAGWCKGKTKKYPYYFCRTKGCPARGMIARNKIEGEFEALLAQLQPSPPMFAMVRQMFKDAWEQFRKDYAASVKAVQDEITEVESQISNLVRNTVSVTNPRVLSAFEKEIDTLELRQLVLREKASQDGQPKGSFEDLFELSIRFLTSPCNTWKSGRFDVQRLVLKLAFSDRLSYNREEGFLNTKTSMPFNMLGGVGGAKKQMVLLERIELSTSPLPRECSTSELQQPAVPQIATLGVTPDQAGSGGTL